MTSTPPDHVFLCHSLLHRNDFIFKVNLKDVNSHLTLSFFVCLCFRVSPGVCRARDGRPGAPAGLKYPFVGSPAHCLHHLHGGRHPPLCHSAAAQRQEGGPGAAFRQVGLDPDDIFPSHDISDLDS